MSIARKVVASAGAVALLVGSMVAVVPSAAQALDRTYGSLVLSPVGPYTSGQVVTMSWTDMNPAMELVPAEPTSSLKDNRTLAAIRVVGTSVFVLVA